MTVKIELSPRTLFLLNRISTKDARPAPASPILPECDPRKFRRKSRIFGAHGSNKVLPVRKYGQGACDVRMGVTKIALVGEMARVDRNPDLKSAERENVCSVCPVEFPVQIPGSTKYSTCMAFFVL